MANPLILNDSDRAAVAQAVTEAEAQTAAEIVTIAAQRSDTYADVALVWAIAVALLALGALAAMPDFYLGLVDRVTGAWEHRWTPRDVFELALGVASLKFLGMWLLQLWQPLRLALVPGALKHRRVRARATTLFHVAGEGRTSAGTAVLIYLSAAERRAEIVADTGISAKVDPAEWGAAMAALIAGVRAGAPGQGLVAAVGKVGAVLAQHVPRGDDDTNELPDRLIEV